MATVARTAQVSDSANSSSAGAMIWLAMQWLGSLKLTVTLFAISLLLVFAGTLAQHHLNMLEVKERYFLSWIAPMYFEDLVPYAFFPHKEPLRGMIPIPGGALVGALLMINLICAKITRFHIHAAGSRLAAGIVAIVLGLVTVYLIVSSGHNADGLQGEPPISYDAMWNCILALLAVAMFGCAALVYQRSTLWLRVACAISALSILVFLIFSLSTGFRIGDPGMRIVWQLTKGLGAGVILLVGCLLIFRKQGGNVLLHFGVGLLMFGQFVFGDRQTEQRLNLIEGKSSNVYVNLDQVELVFIRQDGTDQDVVAVPGKLLEDAAGTSTVIEDERLPFAVRVQDFFANSRLADASKEGKATDQGLGREIAAFRAPGAGGTNGQINIASAYIELLNKQDKASRGTHLVSQWFSDREELVADGRAKDEFDSVSDGTHNYQLGLRFARTTKPFWVQLSDVQRVDYSGSDTPRDYRSKVRIFDPETGEDRREQIWMNNPLRYRGETFYQSNYTPLPNGKEMTGLQVVQNSGWLIPYVACSITALGMCVHFAGTLVTFTRRRHRELTRTAATDPETSAPTKSSRWQRWLPRLGVLSVAFFAFLALVPWPAVMNQLRPAQRDLKLDYHALGQIPVQFGGRVMPLAAYANQTLKAISNKTSLPLEEAPGAISQRVDAKRLGALQWLMEVAIDDERIDDLPMVRIDAQEVRDEFGLPKRKSKLYTINEIRREAERFEEIVTAAREKETRDLSFKERKLIELDNRLRAFTLTASSFRIPDAGLPPLSKFPPGTTEEQRTEFGRQLVESRMKELKQMKTPGIVPPAVDSSVTFAEIPKWSAFATAHFDATEESADTKDTKLAGVNTFSEILKGYREEDPAKFNAAVDQQLAAIASLGAQVGYSPDKVNLERWMESNWPTELAMAIYLLALTLGLVELMVQMPRLRQVTWSILLIALAIHSIALLSRIVITGRAPVINLYSSAVFIGWAGVIFGIVQERVFRYGVGNLLAAGSGVLALLVAYGLSAGDTMPVLQAVLDTQFWLGTHVISVTLGYTATMVAGLLGIIYLVFSWIGVNRNWLREVYRSVYGATCFGILFSFVGTVLGGLWADDSWGRFWGWDPKENGALLIVIWNAMMLHARWDSMVAARGFSILAIGGNIVTAWSYFGTNELGIGLHSYGFTSGVLMWLSVFIASQAAFMVLGFVIPSRSSAEDGEAKKIATA